MELCCWFLAVSSLIRLIGSTQAISSDLFRTVLLKKTSANGMHKEVLYTLRKLDQIKISFISNKGNYRLEDYLNQNIYVDLQNKMTIASHCFPIENSRCYLCNTDEIVNKK